MTKVSYMAPRHEREIKKLTSPCLLTTYYLPDRNKSFDLALYPSRTPITRTDPGRFRIGPRIGKKSKTAT
jgi:hypothetical protein